MVKMGDNANHSPQIDTLIRMRRWFVDQVEEELRANHSPEKPEVQAKKILDKTYKNTQVNLPDEKRQELFDNILEDLFSYGPIQPLLDDPSITEIMVNRHDLVYIEKDGKIKKSDITFPDDQAIVRLIDKIIEPLGRRIDASSPTVDGRLRDGSRVNAVIPPVAIDGPSLTIRKFGHEKMKMEDFFRHRSLTPHMAEFLRACVISRLNIIISGGTGSGKTTLLNILSGFIPESERVVTIEDSAELQLHQEHVVRLETQPAGPDGEGEVPIRHLVRNALRMRPDRIVVGEVRGGEALDMLQAMNTGHDGSLTTVHANSPRDALSRLETLVLFAGFELPLRVVREQIASAVDLIVQQSRLRDGSRKVTSIAEVIGMEGETIVMNEIFRFVESGTRSDGRVIGDFEPTGMRPMFEYRLKRTGFKLSPEIFGVDKIFQKDKDNHR
jgi:pilus assembly protein CpaF